MSRKFLIDENLPADIPIGIGPNFIHASILIPFSDSEIWKYAIENDAVIVTKDTDFYHRYLTVMPRAKVIWFRTCNMKKTSFKHLVNNIWSSLEELLMHNNFIIVNPESIEAYS